MSSQDPRTASTENSIWRDLPEDEFRQHLVRLEERTNAIPMDPKIFSAKDWVLKNGLPFLNLEDSSLSSHPIVPSMPVSIMGYHTKLPLEVEQQVADDFACLAAVVEGGQSVAAACIEQDGANGGMTLRFAAVDLSLNEEVKNYLRAIGNFLAEAATATTSLSALTSDQYIEKLYDQVIRLHHRRLLARLRSTKWEKPKYLSKSHKKPLWQDYTNLQHRLQFAYTKTEKSTRKMVSDELHNLSSIYSDFESSPITDEHAALRYLVTSSHIFCSKEEIKDYLHRLQTQTSQNPPTPQVGAAIKSLRQIQKIANYRRISVSLIQTAQKYPRLFCKIDIGYLTPYSSILTTIGHHEWAKTCHVHAEVQLAVYYDLQFHSSNSNSEFATLKTTPKVIGTSKWLCFLCYQFLQSHKLFFPSKTHGQLYDQWTVPDLKEFGQCEGMVKRYRNILRIIDEVIVAQTKEEPELWRLKPMTSCITDSENKPARHDSEIFNCFGAESK